MIAAIPSPPFNSIGPLTIYGLLIALGVFAAVSLGQKRWVARGGHEDDVSSIAIWAVPAGIVGARLYHVITDFQRFVDEPWWRVFALREGGLGIPGGIAFGLLAGIFVAKRRGLNIGAVVDAVIPGLPLAQAIGRVGNWFNQELYGRPTDLPWALEIDADHRGSIPEEFQSVEAFPTFHPTFLYEGLWNIGLVGFMLFVDRKGWLPRGRLVSIYFIGYGIGRAWVEALRIDAANEIFGLRINLWMSLGLVIAGLIILAWPKKATAVQDAVDAPETPKVDDVKDLNGTADTADTGDVDELDNADDADELASVNDVEAT